MELVLLSNFSLVLILGIVCGLVFVLGLKQ